MSMELRRHMARVCVLSFPGYLAAMSANNVRDLSVQIASVPAEGGVPS